MPLNLNMKRNWIEAQQEGPDETLPLTLALGPGPPLPLTPFDRHASPRRFVKAPPPLPPSSLPATVSKPAKLIHNACLGRCILYLHLTLNSVIVTVYKALCSSTKGGIIETGLREGSEGFRSLVFYELIIYPFVIMLINADKRMLSFIADFRASPLCLLLQH